MKDIFIREMKVSHEHTTKGKVTQLHISLGPARYIIGNQIELAVKDEKMYYVSMLGYLHEPEEVALMLEKFAEKIREDFK